MVGKKDRDRKGKRKLQREEGRKRKRERGEGELQEDIFLVDPVGWPSNCNSGNNFLL